MDMINHISHPPFCPHEMDVLGYVKQSIASAYTSLLSRIDSHIEDDRVHVTCEEKDKWDNKVDKTQFRELELRMTEKADFNELTELKEQLSILKVAVDNKIDSDTAKSVVTETEFDELANTVNSLSSKVNLLNQTINNTFDTSEFATTQWVQDQHYIKTVDLKTSVIDLLNNSREVKDTLSEIITNTITNSDNFIETVVERIENVIDNGTTINSIKDYVDQNFVKNGTALGTINGQVFTQGGSITIQTAQSGSTVSWNGIKTSSDAGSYQIGKLNIDGVEYTLYGIDTNSQDGTGFTESEIRTFVNDQLQNDNDAKQIINNLIEQSGVGGMSVRVENKTLIIG